jgi:hypothetical protein
MGENPPLRYPLKKITASDDYLKIQIIKYQPPGIGNQPGSFALNTSDQTYSSKATILKTIYLPIPDNLQDSNTTSWGSSTLNPIEAAVSAGFEAGMTGGVKDMFKKILAGGKNIQEFAQTGLGQDAIASGAAGFAVKALTGGGDVSTYVSRATGLVANQNIELLFNGVAIRSEFTFGYDLVPRSKEESDIVKDIIRQFKYHSAARKGAPEFGPAAGLFLKTPNVFKLTYMSGNRDHPFLNRFKICALMGMSVDYAASGTYSTYPDATPTHMKMALTFKELTPIYAEDYDVLANKGDTSVGY